MYPQSMYKARATSWRFTETSSGNPKFDLEFDVFGLADGRPCDPGSRTCSIAPTTEDGLEWLLRTVRHLGYDGHDVFGLDPDSPDAFDFTGVEFVVSCKHEEYNGKTREKWTVSTPPPKVKPTSDKLQALNERFAAKAKEMATRQGKPRADLQPPASSAGEDVPF